MSARGALAEISASKELLANLTLRELRGKYKRTALGWGWSLLNPLALMATYSLVFSVLLRIEPPPGKDGLTSYPLFLLCALLPWTFVSNTMTGAMESLLQNANLIKKTYFRREILVVATVLSFLVSFGTEMAVLALAFLIVGSMVVPWLPGVALLMALLTLFASGLALLLAVVNVYFRDARYLVGIALQLWFYASPILYPIAYVNENLPGWAASLYEANPMVGFVESFRDLLYVQQAPPLATVGYLVVVSAGVFALGAWCFSRLEGRLAEEL